MFPYTWLEEADRRIKPHIRRTPLTYDPERDLYLKWENRQETGSFKLRGALNKILALQPWERERGLVAASAGNHGQGVALAGRLVGAPVLVFASASAVPAKLEAMRALGAGLRLVPGGYGEAEKAALEYAAAHSATWISPYNDGQIIAGQGTLALEAAADLQVQGQAVSMQDLTWIVPVGGGGLISGIGAALREGPTESGLSGSRLVGVQSEASPFLYHSYHYGTQQGAIELPSLADGLSGPVEAGSLTLALARRYVDDFVLVSEDDIRAAICFAWQQYGERIEGSAAAALAAVLSGRISARPALVLITGGNIQPEVHAQIVHREPGT